MNPRELLLLSPYTYPAHSSMTLADEDMATWMNAYTALWHPAALWGASGPPRVEVPYDFEDPQAHHIYAVPEDPPMIMPEDWEDRVQEVGALILKGKMDRDETLAQALERLGKMVPGPIPDLSKYPNESESDSGNAPESSQPGEGSGGSPEESGPESPGGNAGDSSAAVSLSPEEIQAKLVTLEPEQVRPFYAIGLGYLLLASLSEATEHENLLETEEFWIDVQRAIAELIGIPCPPPFDPNAPPHDAFSEGEDPVYDDGSGYDSEGPAADDSYRDSYQEDENYNDYDDGYDEDYQYEYGPRVVSKPDYFRTPGEGENWYGHLVSAANRILSAREILYPVTIYLVDLFLPDEKHLDGKWPPSYQKEIPFNLIASGALLEKWQQQHPQRFQEMKEAFDKKKIEVCGGCYQEREDALLPVESQLWNLLKGQEVTQKLLGRRIETFARRRFGAHPQLPLFLSSTGLNRAVLIPFDDSALPEFSSVLVSWPSPDGKQVDSFVRKPYDADSLETMFNLGHYIHKTIREDHNATLVFLHENKAAHPWIEDLLELSKFGPIFGEWFSFTRFFNEVMNGEFTDNHNADEFHFDHLSERTGEAEHKHHHLFTASDRPVSGFAVQQRLRRRVDTCYTLASMQRGLAGKNDPLKLEEELKGLENTIEEIGTHPTQAITSVKEKLDQVQKQTMEALSQRLLSQATSQEPGYLVMNPCSYIRRVVLELEAGKYPLPLKDHIKACQVDDGKLKVVLEVPALGFAWIPRSGPEGTAPPTMRMRLADDRHVRNEFFEAEIDPKTGGIYSIASRRNPVNRLAQRLTFNPGSTMKATSVKATSVGPALGEVVAEGVLLGEHEQVLAKFRQRFRAWLGRPVLEVRVELYPEQPSAGYPWHAYYGARFAWREERTLLLRGLNGTSYITHHKRPQTPDFLELRGHRENTVIFPCGLPFIQKHDNRMLDLILMPQGETTHTYDFAIGLDREHPMLTAQGLVTPVPMIETDKGPPHIGATGWLYHLNTANLLVTSMRPGGLELPPLDPALPPTEPPVQDLHNAITVRLLECGSQTGQAEFRCVRDPVQACLLDARGERILDSTTSGDMIFLEISPGDFNQLQIEF